MNRPTIRHVAQKARVGIGTVSRVLNNSPSVSPETRQRVMDAIRELNFKPNAAARHLSNNMQLHHIGVITQSFINYYSFAERLRGVQRALGALNNPYELILYNVSSMTYLDEQIDLIVQNRAVQGLLVIDLRLTDEQRISLDEANVPYVGLNNFTDVSWPCVATDNVEGGYLATKYLLEHGHRRIAYVGDDFVDSFGFRTSEERYRGYCQALAEYDVEPRDEYLRLGLYGYEAARHLARDLLSMDRPPTAVFAMSDIQALGCIAAARAAGLRIPQDLSVLGYDDLEVSEHTGLTTVRQHLERSGQYGVRYLLDLIRLRDRAQPPMLPALTVIPRETIRSI
jgi:DNA-binding LacI/PurR family transcriptional regulator